MRYEEECSCLRVVRLLEVRSPVDHRVLDNELKLMSARRPGAYCICNLLRLKTRRLGRLLKKTSSTQNNKLKVLSESDVDSVSPPELAQLCDAQLDPLGIGIRHLDNPTFFRQSQHTL